MDTETDVQWRWSGSKKGVDGKKQRRNGKQGENWGADEGDTRRHFKCGAKERLQVAIVRWMHSTHTKNRKTARVRGTTRA